MRIAFFVNDIDLEIANYTTTLLALEALRTGHEVWYISAGDFAYDTDEMMHAHARTVPKRRYDSTEVFLKDLQGDKARIERIVIEELDVLMLRSDPAHDYIERPWAHNIGVVFGQLAADRGVIVLNDPHGLAKASTKLYFQQFPEAIRPKTLITRIREDIKKFIHEQGGAAVLKPLQGSGGENVFLIQRGESSNLNQMIDVVSRDGYIIAQEFLPEAAKGDTRLYLLNGVPFEYKGKLAALGRKGVSGDIRNNMHRGGKAVKAKVTDQMLKIAEMVRPKLVHDGMFFVGLDIVGAKLMEINVFSPGGLYSTSKLMNVNFPAAVIEAIERKVQYERFDDHIANAELAVL